MESFWITSLYHFVFYHFGLHFYNTLFFKTRTQTFISLSFKQDLKDIFYVFFFFFVTSSMYVLYSLIKKKVCLYEFYYIFLGIKIEFPYITKLLGVL